VKLPRDWTSGRARVWRGNFTVMGHPAWMVWQGGRSIACVSYDVAIHLATELVRRNRWRSP
jgi:hypothetical protein